MYLNSKNIAKIMAIKNIDTYCDVLVVAERIDSEYQKVTYELISEGKKLAIQSDENLCVLSWDHKNFNETQAQVVFRQGVDTLYLLENENINLENDETAAKAIANFISKVKPNIVLFGATYRGKTLAPMIATHLETGLTADCSELKIDEKNRKLLQQIRPACGGNIMATVVCPVRRPQMASVRAGILKKTDQSENRNGNVVKVPIDDISFSERIKILTTHKKVNEISFENKMDIVVTAGGGIGSPDNLRLVEELAELINGTVGVTRLLSDQDHRLSKYLIGQTGKAVKPRLYFAFGVSGAIQHTIGMKNSEIIVAVNTDPNAPIFDIADYGIIEDSVSALKCLISAFKSD